MAENHKLSVEERTSFGKGAARKIRAVNKIPAVLYGHGTEPRHLTLPGHELMLLVRKSNAVIELDITGEIQLALVKDVQRDPVKQIIEHVDLVVVNQGEKVTVDVPVHVQGETASGTLANLDASTVTLEAEATHIPENVVVDVTDLEGGAQITAADLKLPAGVSLVTEGDVLVVGVVAEQLAEEPVAEGEGEAAGTAEATTDESADMNTWLVVGLGNPGPGYAGNRHNVGAMVATELAQRLNATFKTHRANAMVAEGRAVPGGPKLVLAKPNSYMNTSGGPVANLAKYFSIPAERVVVVHDDLDLPFDSIKLKADGGHGGQNGVRDIIKSLNTPEFVRVRVGIGRPPGRQDPADYVLRDFAGAEKTQLPIVLADAADAVELVVAEGLAAAQLKFHSR